MVRANGPMVTNLGVAGKNMADLLSTISIDERSPVPAYYQVYEALRNHLQDPVPSGLFPGTKLPTERALAARLGVARGTLRQALARLESEGMVFRRQGDGTYVAEPRVEHDMRFLHGFTAEFTSRGKRVHSRVLHMRAITAPPRVRQLLGAPDSADNVIELRRVRSLDGSPVSLETVWLSAARCGALLGRELTDNSLYATLSEIGIVPVSGSEHLTATVLDPYEASELDQQPGAAAMLVERVTHDAEGQCIEVVKTLLRADRFSIRTDLDLEVPAHPNYSGDLNDELHPLHDNP